MLLTFWKGIISDTDAAVVERGGYGQMINLGDHPALLVVDLQRNYVGENRPILDQIDAYPSGVGERAWRALAAIRRLLPEARAANLPFIYTVVARKSVVIDDVDTPWAMTGGLVRSSEFMTARDPGSRIVDGLEPDESRGDILIEKAYASAFFGTALGSYLTRRRIDTLLIVGGTTSGCVRATAVDGYSRGFSVGIIADCVFDRIDLSHMASLLDVHMKYGSVLSLDEALDYLSAQRAARPPASNSR